MLCLFQGLYWGLIAGHMYETRATLIPGHVCVRGRCTHPEARMTEGVLYSFGV